MTRTSTFGGLGHEVVAFRENYLSTFPSHVTIIDKSPVPYRMAQVATGERGADSRAAAACRSRCVQLLSLLLRGSDDK